MIFKFLFLISYDIICAVNIKFEFQSSFKAYFSTMGNQNSSQPNHSILALQTLLRPNKHFSNQSIRNLPQQKLIQLMQDLKIDTPFLSSNTNSLPTQYSLNSMVFIDDFSFNKISHRLTWRTGAQHLHIFNIKHIKIEQHKNLCSLARKIYVSQDGYEFTLKDLIQQKISKKQSFSEEQILILLNKITQAIVWMHDNEFKSIPLDSESIFFIEDSTNHSLSSQCKFANYTCKIIDQDLVQTNSYKNFLESLAQVKHQPENQMKKPVLQIYLSPQLLEQAKSSNFYPTNLSLKSDIFTLGMMIMELCCQEEMYFCYNLDNLTFDYESLIHRIAKISYSNELKLLLAEMLEYDENNRIGFVSLKEKLGRLIVKPFQETRKLKRRSSSTMLRELLSCSRASASVQSKQPTTQKHGFSRITSLSQSNKKIEQNAKLEDTSNKGMQTHESLRKSNSLVNLKCKTNSFLTSKKSTLMRVNSSTKLQIDSRKLNDVSHEVNKVDYKNILKKRLKTESKVMQCPRGQIIDQSLSSSVLKVENNQIPQLCQSNKFTENNNKATQEKQIESQMQKVQKQHLESKKFQKKDDLNIQQKQTLEGVQKQQNLSARSKEPSKLSYVQKKVIHLDKINISSSHSVSNLKLKETMISHDQINNNEKSFVEKNKENQDNSNLKTLTKQSVSSSKITKKQVSLSVQKALNLKPTTNEDIKQSKIPTESSKIEDSSYGLSNKNWIMGKLKADKNPLKKLQTSISNLILVKKDKTSSKKKQQSLTKHKSISLINAKTKPFKENIQTERIGEGKLESELERVTKPLNFESNKDVNGFTQTKQLDLKQSNQWNKNDTIIKHLEMTEEKQILPSQSRFEDRSSTISGTIKDQMELINRVLEKCQLSSSRWQQESRKFDFRGYQTDRNLNFENFSDSNTFVPISHACIAENQAKQQINGEKQKIVQKREEVSQFKKKSKVIDIDLGTFSYEDKNQQLRKGAKDESANRKQLIKAEKKPCSKLQKLKQLTIFTEQTTSDNPTQSEDKQNNMLNSNLQSRLSNLGSNKLANLDSSIDHFKKSSQPQFSYQNRQIFNHNPIPRIQQVNLAMVTPSLITPNNLNDLNKFYGKGMTLQSEQQSLGSTLHKKDFSTLSKPFQQIQLNYTDTTPLISSPNFPKDFYQFKETKNESQGECIRKQSISVTSQKSSQQSSIKKQNCLYSINAQELTFRLKPKVSDTEKEEKSKKTEQPKYQKMNFFQKQDGSFVMREENPIKNIQTSSIIGQDKSTVGQRNTVEELFKESSKFENYGLNSQKEMKQSYYQANEENSENMNSSCDSINLSQIEYQGHQSTSFIYPEAIHSNQRGRKHKHISILESGDQSFDHSKKGNLNLKNLKQITQKDESQNQQTNRHSEYDTYRGYLSSNKATSTIHLVDNFVYEGQINKDGEFEGNGMISKKNTTTGENQLVYTGSFVNGMYHGFGTLYDIQIPQEKRLKLPSTGKRMSFGEQRLHKKSQIKVDKYFLLSDKPIKYEGEFVNGLQNGFGTYTYENGDRYSGCIKDGVIEGYGTYHFSESGESISGIWKNNSYAES